MTDMSNANNMPWDNRTPPKPEDFKGPRVKPIGKVHNTKDYLAALPVHMRANLKKLCDQQEKVAGRPMDMKLVEAFSKLWQAAKEPSNYSETAEFNLDALETEDVKTILASTEASKPASRPDPEFDPLYDDIVEAVFPLSPNEKLITTVERVASDMQASMFLTSAEVRQTNPTAFCGGCLCSVRDNQKWLLKNDRLFCPDCTIFKQAD